MRYAVTVVAFMLGLGLISASSALAEEGKAEPTTVDGWIHAVNVEAGTFVLGGKNESQTTFRCLLKVEGKREATKILLDDERVTFEAAIKSGRKASVTYVKVSDEDLWVWKVAVTSAAK